MKAVVAVFTNEKNADYFSFCLRYILKSAAGLAKHKDIFNDPLRAAQIYMNVVDFGEDPEKIKSIIKSVNQPVGLIHRPGAGFCSNMNFFLDECKKHDVDLLIQINDDAVIEYSFLENAFLEIKKTGAAFIGGIPQDDGNWNESLDKIRLPKPEDLREHITNFTRLWWEASACVINVSEIGDIRFDEYYDPTGLIADNDFLLRLAKRNKTIVRSWMLRFWHGRGLTQTRVVGRVPSSGPDEIRLRAVEHFKKVWRVNIINMSMPKRVFDFPDLPMEVGND